MTSQKAPDSTRRKFSDETSKTGIEAGLNCLLNSINNCRDQAELLQADVVVSLMEMAHLEVLRLSKVNQAMQRYMEEDAGGRI